MSLAGACGGKQKSAEAPAANPCAPTDPCAAQADPCAPGDPCAAPDENPCGGDDMGGNPCGDVE